MNDTTKAVNWLKNNKSYIGMEEIYWTVEEIHKYIQAKCGVPALARNLRRKRELHILESRTRHGKSYKEYCYKEVPFTATQCKIQYKSCADRIDKINNDFLNKYLAPILIKLKEIVGI